MEAKAGYSRAVVCDGWVFVAGTTGYDYATMTMPDAERYLESYRRGIRAVGKRRGEGDIFAAPSISVKLSALHPRYEYTQRQRVLDELVPKLVDLAKLAEVLRRGA